MHTCKVRHLFHCKNWVMVFKIALVVLYVPQAQMVLWNGNSSTLLGNSAHLRNTGTTKLMCQFVFSFHGRCESKLFPKQYTQVSRELQSLVLGIMQCSVQSKVSFFLFFLYSKRRRKMTSPTNQKMRRTDVVMFSRQCKKELIAYIFLSIHCWNAYSA